MSWLSTSWSTLPLISSSWLESSRRTSRLASGSKTSLSKVLNWFPTKFSSLIWSTCQNLLINCWACENLNILVIRWQYSMLIRWCCSTFQDLIMVASEKILVGRDRKELPSRISSSSLIIEIKPWQWQSPYDGEMVVGEVLSSSSPSKSSILLSSLSTSNLGKGRACKEESWLSARSSCSRFSREERREGGSWLIELPGG